MRGISMGWNDILSVFEFKKKIVFLSQKISGIYKNEKLELIFDYENKYLKIRTPFTINFSLSVDKKNN
jgi:hypothetical protein